jgi:glycosyltransferase involved in cell wall biosynthesis
MSCGAAVIAANTSSLPEVIGRSDALFDPRNDAAITQKMVDVLNDQTFHSNLCLHGLQQAKKFSWDESARISIAAFEEQHSRNRAIQGTTTVSTLHTPKPRLAFFSPLPPARSGIANYCAELLPELAEYFDIELIVDQSEIDDDWLRSNFPVRTWQWFDQHAIRYDRVLYHFGNSTYHTYMFDMLEKHPGVVVMHDFYLSGLFAHLYFKAENLAWWPNALYESHGYGALIEKRKVENLNDIIWKYPCNFSLLEKAEGVIVHSQYAVDLAKQWYGDARSVDLAKIPHLRKLPDNVDRLAARKQLGLCDEDFLLCSFGMLGEAKLNQRLLDVWLNSPLAEDVNCHLVFVGQPDEGEYCSHLLDTIKRKNKADHIKITGFADIELFRTYLMAADGAVQLRGLSRGETSGTVLDCMAYGVPTIINSNGSLRELPELGLVKLNDKFLDGQLQEKLLMLRNDPTSRRQIGTDAIEYIRENNAPKYIAKKYFTEIETFFQSNSASRLHRTLIKIADTDMPAIPSEEDLLMTAKCLSMNDEIRGVPQLLIDISAFSKKSKGVENEKREVLLRAVLTKLVLSAPAFIRIEPVITYELEVHSVLRYARALSCSIFDLPPLSLADEVVEMRSCDIIVALVADSASIKQGLIDRFELRNNQRNNLDISEILTEPPEKWNEKIEHLVMAFWAENGLG